MREGLSEPDVALRAAERASRLSSRGMWRSLDELARTDAFREAVEREFPEGASELAADDVTRRNFLRLMGASMALAGVYGCSERPSGKILPYVNPPEQVVPGMPLMFASAMPLNGFGLGVLAVSHEGRPTKIEGNPDHPATLGGSNVFVQASVLELYDPERARDAMRLRSVSSWATFDNELRSRLDAKRASGGAGIRLLTGTVTSPTLAWQIQQFLRQFPQARWHHYDPLARANAAAGARLAFGRPVNTVYRFREPERQAEAKVIVSLDSDFLWEEPGSLRYSRQFIGGRKVRVRHWDQTTMNRLYVIESTMTLTGSMADHRMPACPREVAQFARALAARLGGNSGSGGDGTPPAAMSALLDAVVADLQANHGASLIVVGESMPPEIHALAHAMNATLGNVGKTLYYTDRIEVTPDPADPYESLRQLIDDMNGGRVDTLLILGGNPAYDAPADLKFADALFLLSMPTNPVAGMLPAFTARLGLYGQEHDETALLSQWQLPESHYLEAWGDVRAFEGTASIIQPLIAPLYRSRSAIELMDVVLTPPSQVRFRGGYEIVREYWASQVHGEFEAWWQTSVQRGVIANSAAKPIDVSAKPPPPAAPANEPATSGPSTAPASSGDLEIVFRPDPSIGDGRFANNGWLQECPKFFSKLVWSNAALMSWTTAQRLRTSKYPGLANGSVLRFTYRLDGVSYAVEAPVLVMPGLPDNVVTMHLGYGRTQGGSSAMEPGRNPRGFSAYAMRSSRSPWSATGVSHEATGARQVLVVTHNHFAMDTLPDWGRADVHGELRPEAIVHPSAQPDGSPQRNAEEERELHNRRLVRTATLKYFNERPEHRHFVREAGTEAEKRPLLSIYPGWDYSKGYQWGMSIDMQACIGCNACLVACQAENNIPVVGPDEVARQREMHWIRIDGYFASSLSDREIREINERGGDPGKIFENPRVYHQPVPCMHCENAPCELVCPVGATAHSTEGLNMMVYNRCVGTRYCSNNCPYKVRRFNFFNYFKDGDPTFDLQHNPQVTVRSRGVMEKCTYCVQRLQRTRIEIEKMIVRQEERMRGLEKERQAAPSERQAALAQEIGAIRRQITLDEFRALETLQTACQQACPTEAIAFGNLLPVNVIDESGRAEPRLSQVAKLKQEPLDYPLLADLTTVPRTTYMARLRNPNDQLEPGAES